MADGFDGPGVLVVQNGKHRGAKMPLGAPVTLIGHGEACDVRLSGPTVGEVHCVIAVTPAGLALRTWYPTSTALNGTLVSAALLKQGDLLRVGPCVFQVALTEEDLVPLTPAPAELTETPWHVDGRLTELHAQEEELARQVEERYQQMNKWAAELASRREQFRQEHATLAARAKQIRRAEARVEKLKQAARADRQRVRDLYHRFLGHMKARWATERRAAAEVRADLTLAKSHLAESEARLQAERENLAAETARTEKRLAEQWANLAESQRRLFADRQQAEQTLASYRAELDSQATELVERARQLAEAQDVVETQVAQLRDEAAHLEARAAQTREIVMALEARRASLEAEGTIQKAETPGVVALLPNSKHDAEALMRELGQKELELTRDRQTLQLARMELERRAAELHDQRAVLAEQVANLAIARQTWQTAEYRTVAELEVLARTLNAREMTLDARETELEAAERLRQSKATDLGAEREQLERWQAELTSRERDLTELRHEIDRDMAERTATLDQTERTLELFRQRWSAERVSELDELRDILSSWVQVREQQRSALDALEIERQRLADELAPLVADRLAMEQAWTEANPGPATERRYRTLKRKWERQARRWQADLDQRRLSLMTEATNIAEKSRTLVATLTALADKAASRSEADVVSAAILPFVRPTPEPTTRRSA